MLLIDNSVVAEILNMRECIDAQEAAFRRIPAGSCRTSGTDRPVIVDKGPRAP